MRSPRFLDLQRKPRLLARGASGSLGTGSGVGESDGTTADGACAASSGAAERMSAQVSTLAAKMTASGPHKRRAVCIPPASGFFDVAHDVLRRSWRRTFLRAVDKYPLN